ncbi:MAG: hypothetical protein M3Z04_19080, partial [Chloroflexota bacterium]|nr:hypothetical protein [Chloroflexota bacterium]
MQLQEWRTNIRHKLEEFASDPNGSKARLGVQTVMGFLLASTLDPIIMLGAMHGSQDALLAFTSVLGNVGANLLSNSFQKNYDKHTLGSEIEIA